MDKEGQEIHAVNQFQTFYSHFRSSTQRRRKKYQILNVQLNIMSIRRNISLLFFYYYIYLFTAIGLLPGCSGYFTCKQNMKLVTTRFKSGGLYEKHVVATWNLGNHLSICY